MARALLVAPNQEVCRRGWTEIVKRLDLAPLAAPGGGRGDLGLDVCRGRFSVGLKLAVTSSGLTVNAAANFSARYF